MATKALKDWIVHLWGKKIFVEGIVIDDGELWHSSPISESEGSHCVKTASGSKYLLVGDMDVNRALQEKVPSAFIETFSSGFPTDWKVIVEKVVTERCSAKRPMARKASSTRNRHIEKEESIVCMSSRSTPCAGTVQKEECLNSKTVNSRHCVNIDAAVKNIYYDSTCSTAVDGIDRIYDVSTAVCLGDYNNVLCYSAVMESGICSNSLAVNGAVIYNGGENVSLASNADATLNRNAVVAYDNCDSDILDRALAKDIYTMPTVNATLLYSSCDSAGAGTSSLGNAAVTSSLNVISSSGNSAGVEVAKTMPSLNAAVLCSNFGSGGVDTPLLDDFAVMQNLDVAHLNGSCNGVCVGLPPVSNNEMMSMLCPAGLCNGFSIADMDNPLLENSAIMPALIAVATGSSLPCETAAITDDTSDTRDQSVVIASDTGQRNCLPANTGGEENAMEGVANNQKSKAGVERRQQRRRRGKVELLSSAVTDVGEIAVLFEKTSDSNKSNDKSDGCFRRQSCRTRLAPLRHWANERQIVSPRDGNVKIMLATADALDNHQRALQKVLSAHRKRKQNTSVRRSSSANKCERSTPRQKFQTARRGHRTDHHELDNIIGAIACVRNTSGDTALHAKSKKMCVIAKNESFTEIKPKNEILGNGSSNGGTFIEMDSLSTPDGLKKRIARSKSPKTRKNLTFSEQSLSPVDIPSISAQNVEQLEESSSNVSVDMLGKSLLDDCMLDTPVNKRQNNPAGVRTTKLCKKSARVPTAESVVLPSCQQLNPHVVDVLDSGVAASEVKSTKLVEADSRTTDGVERTACSETDELTVANASGNCRKTTRLNGTAIRRLDQAKKKRLMLKSNSGDSSMKMSSTASCYEQPKSNTRNLTRENSSVNTEEHHNRDGVDQAGWMFAKFQGLRPLSAVSQLSTNKKTRPEPRKIAANKDLK